MLQHYGSLWDFNGSYILALQGADFLFLFMFPDLTIPGKEKIKGAGQVINRHFFFFFFFFAVGFPHGKLWGK